ncbi:MAG TPA: PTS sugar transporter subunit IIA [Planctomycetota bacterium]|nr:PTS sugar transporter subunit IIA [Planctomycetota bacterium]OQC20150.1 MAG: Nitrogen regulatory protein [Planctomycetes bacterium ADurb.Bin069]HNR99292.1 PTS sugar transporter subunit IIA [Planctomycetota bacterium]HNU26093.1 PTS sugar transporter subunit IIA [Planctomycetota bacterium]HOE30868.1 PTS sugar transporter subunit IIA [Planctomycetota bacterium]
MELTVRQAARLLGLSQRTVYRMVVRGELPAYQVHDEYRFNRTELLEWALANRVSALDAILEENVPEGGPALPTLGEALAAGGIVYDLEGADKPSALKALVRALPLPENVDRELLLRVLIAREALGSTGMGGGVAVPHVRNPIVLRVPAPQVTLGFLAKPIDFQALDGKPVFALFSLVSPTVRTHLHLLSRLGFALQDAELKALLDRRGRPEEIAAAIRRIEAEIAARAAAGPAGADEVDGL